VFCSGVPYAEIWRFPKSWGYPQIIHSYGIFHYKPSFFGYPPCMETYGIGFDQNCGITRMIFMFQWDTWWETTGSVQQGLPPGVESFASPPKCWDTRASA
jgi:hypothetical protein